MARSSNTSTKTKTVKKKTKKDPKVATTTTRTGPWSSREKEQFDTAFIKYGDSRWAQIADEIPSRDREQVKTYARKLFSKHPEKKEQLIRSYEANEDKVAATGGHWTSEEKEQFDAAFIKYGDSRWTAIADEIPTRDSKQVRNYGNRMSAEKKEQLIRSYEANEDKVGATGGTGPWTSEEKEQFDAAFIKYGDTRWAQIAKEIPTRDSKQVTNHGNRMSAEKKEQLIRLYEANEDKVTAPYRPVRVRVRVRVRQCSEFAGSESKIVFGVASTRDLAIAVKPELDSIRDNLRDSIERKQTMSTAERKLTNDVGNIITSAFHSNQSAESAGAFAARQIMQLVLENRKPSANSLPVVSQKK